VKLNRFPKIKTNWGLGWKGTKLKMDKLDKKKTQNFPLIDDKSFDF